MYLRDVSLLRAMSLPHWSCCFRLSRLAERRKKRVMKLDRSRVAPLRASSQQEEKRPVTDARASFVDERCVGQSVSMSMSGLRGRPMVQPGMWVSRVENGRTRLFQDPKRMAPALLTADQVVVS